MAVRNATPANLASTVSQCAAGDTVVLAAGDYYAWFWPSVDDVTFQAHDHYEYMAVYKGRGHNASGMSVRVRVRRLGAPRSRTSILGVYFDLTSNNVATDSNDINQVIYSGQTRVVWRDCAFRGRPAAGGRAILNNMYGVPAGANHLYERCYVQDAGKSGDMHDHAFYLHDGAWSGTPWTSTPAGTIRECLIRRGGEYAVQFYASPEGWLWDRNVSWNCNHSITFSSETGSYGPGARYCRVSGSVLARMTNSRGDSWAAMVESYDPTGTVAGNRLADSWIGDTGGKPRIASNVTSDKVTQTGLIGQAASDPGFADPENGDFTITTTSRLYQDAQAAGLVGQLGPASIWPAFTLPGGSTSNSAPNAMFTISGSPTAGQIVTFTDTSSDPDGWIATRAWDLDNDGAFDDATGATATKTFPQAGTYTVRLQVTDDKGATATAVRTVTVAPGPSGGGLTYNVTITASTLTPRVGEQVTLTGTVTDPDGQVTTYGFDLNGDGVLDTTGVLVTTKVWDTPGTYTVAFRAVGPTPGASLGASRTFTVTAAPPPPSTEPRVVSRRGTITVPTQAGAQNITLGFAPKAVIFWGTGDAGEGQSPGARIGMGCATATGQWAFAGTSDDGTAGAKSSRIDSKTDAVIIPGAPGTSARASCALTSQGFTLTWGTVTPSTVHYLALGGTDLQAQAGVSPLATTAGPVSTTTGFTPAVVIACHDVTPADGQVIPSLNLGWGAATPSAGHAVALRDTDAKAPTTALSTQRRDVLIEGVSSYSDTTIARGRLTGVTATGFEVTWDAGTAAGDYGWLALGGIAATLGTITQTAGSSTPSVQPDSTLALPGLYTPGVTPLQAGASQTITVDGAVCMLAWSIGSPDDGALDTTRAAFGFGATDGATQASSWIDMADGVQVASTRRIASTRETMAGPAGTAFSTQLTASRGIIVTWSGAAPTPAPAIGYLTIAPVGAPPGGGTGGTGGTGGSGGGTTPAVPPATRGEWLAELVSVDGVRLAAVHARGRTFTVNRNAGGTGSFTLTPDEAEDIFGLEPGAVDVLITQADTVAYRGPLDSAAGDISATAGSLTFTAGAPEGLLAQRIIPQGRQILATEQTRMAWQIVSDAQAGAGADLGITAGVLPDSIARSKTWDAPTDVMAALTELVQADGGFDYELTPTLTGWVFNTRVPRGRETDLVWELGRNIMGVGHSVDATQIRNRVRAVGQNQVAVDAEDTASIARYRLREQVITLSDANNAVWLGDQARGQLVTEPLVLPRLKLLAGAPDARWADVRCGDVVTVRYTRGWVKLDGRFRVEQITVTIPDSIDGVEQLDVVVSPARIGS